jgi:hypothetical protein
MKNQPLFDQECYRLAEYFLPAASTDLKNKLADYIQYHVEMWWDSELTDAQKALNDG